MHLLVYESKVYIKTHHCARPRSLDRRRRNLIHKRHNLRPKRPHQLPNAIKRRPTQSHISPTRTTHHQHQSQQKPRRTYTLLTSLSLGFPSAVTFSSACSVSNIVRVSPREYSTTQHRATRLRMGRPGAGYGSGAAMILMNVFSRSVWTVFITSWMVKKSQIGWKEEMLCKLEKDVGSKL